MQVSASIRAVLPLDLKPPPVTGGVSMSQHTGRGTRAGVTGFTNVEGGRGGALGVSLWG